MSEYLVGSGQALLITYQISGYAAYAQAHSLSPYPEEISFVATGTSANLDGQPVAFLPGTTNLYAPNFLFAMRLQSLDGRYSLPFPSLSGRTPGEQYVFVQRFDDSTTQWPVIRGSINLKTITSVISPADFYGVGALSPNANAARVRVTNLGATFRFNSERTVPWGFGISLYGEDGHTSTGAGIGTVAVA